MGQILQLVGDAIGSIFDNPVIQFGLQAFVIYWIFLWIAAAYWAFRDMQDRTENPLAPYLAAAFIIGFTPVLFPLAAFVYRVIRPQERIGEVYERNLAEEALLNEIEAVPHCPNCERRVDPDWIICPTCRTRLNRVCPNCNRLVGLDWTLCAWCGKDFARRALTPVVSAPAREALPEPEPSPAAIRTTVRRAAPRSIAGGSASVDPAAER